MFRLQRMTGTPEESKIRKRHTYRTGKEKTIATRPTAPFVWGNHGHKVPFTNWHNSAAAPKNKSHLQSIVTQRKPWRYHNGNQRQLKKANEALFNNSAHWTSRRGDAMRSFSVETLVATRPSSEIKWTWKKKMTENTRRVPKRFSLWQARCSEREVGKFFAFPMGDHWTLWSIKSEGSP